MGSSLRVGTWNCRMGLTRKGAALDAIGADVLVVPEANLGFVPEGRRAILKGAPSSKGLAVYVRDTLSLTVSAQDPGLPWLLPVDVRDGSRLLLTVLALWTVKQNGDRRPSYAAQALEAVERWEESCQRFGRDAWTQVVLAGDFNASLQGPSQAPHLRTIDALTDRCLV